MTIESQMFRREWSELARICLVSSVVAAVLLSIADGIVYANVIMAGKHSFATALLDKWVTDFRYLSEQGVYASTVLLVGAKFFETRSMISVAFDKLDAGKMAMKGPDENNTIWIGRKYGTALEAELVAAALESRLQESAL
jgi:hypothetical protein